MKKREFLRYSGLLLAAAAVSPALTGCRPGQKITKADEPSKAPQAEEKPNPISLELPALPYAADALQPYIDKQTMEIHHGKHHQAYINNLKKAFETKPELANLSFEQLFSKIGNGADFLAVRNNAGGHYNHSLFWKILSAPASNPQTQPQGELLAAINSSFGSLENLLKSLKDAAMGQFGSGWAWLSVSKDKKLFVSATANQDCPLMSNIVPAAQQGSPILGIDVWEHAYYLNYQNKRKDYLEAVMNLVAWQQVETNFKNAMA